VAYIGKNPGTGEIRLFEQIEYGPHNDARQLSPLANSRVWLNNAGTMASMRNFNFAPIAPTTGFLYSGETVTTGFTVGKTQIKLCKPGTRPRVLGAQLYHQTSAGTYYINRFTDGSVWISSTANSRTGTQISWPTAGTTLPRGVRYVMVRIVGGGGRGSDGALLPIRVGGGGGGGATAVCCVRLPENGYATVVVGGQSTTSRVTCGTFTCSANGGSSTATNDGAGGGSVSGGAQTADGILIASASGGSGGNYYGGGSASSISFTDHAPEGGTVAWSQSGGGSGTGRGGGGGSSTIGQGGTTVNGSLSTNGSQGIGPGAGGSGGNYSSGTGAAGLPGALTVWY
jgi:hypothetical protein